MTRYKLLAWGGFVLTAIICAAGILLSLAPEPGQPLVLDSTLNVVTGVLITPMLAFVGAVVAANRQQNPIGWLLIGIGFVWAADNLLANYAQAAFATGTEALPGGLVAAWATGLIWFGIFLGLTFLFHLFPTGTFLSHRWRRVAAWSVLVFLGLVTFFAFASPISVNGSQGTLNLVNPIEVFAASDQTVPVAVLILSIMVLAALSSMLLRFVRARGVEREQMKWVWYAATVLICSIVLGLVLNSTVFWIFSNLIGLGFPIAIGIAILRYRLYDIDLIIRRTLIYAVLTGLLALVYFGSVVLLQELFRAATGQSSEIAIIISTLAIAALFNPLRRRIQEVTDRRFYRRKYDAQKVHAAFGATARDEVELDKLTAELLNVVTETMQPTSVSLWLKTGARAKR